MNPDPGVSPAALTLPPTVSVPLAIPTHDISREAEGDPTPPTSKE